MSKKEEKNIHIYNWESADIIHNNVSDKSVDCIVSDPPYNINYVNDRRKKSRDNIHWINWILNDKDNLVMIQSVYDEYSRVLKDGKHCYIFSRWDVTQDHINALKKSWFIVKNVLICVKNSWSMWDLYWNYASQYETIIFAVKLNKKKQHDKLNTIDWKQRHSNILNYNRVAWKWQLHSHQKPEDLLEFLIKKSTNEGDTILDWFLWSWSTWVACININRKFIWVELDKEIFITANERIEWMLKSNSWK